MAEELTYKNEAAAGYDRAFARVTTHFVPFLLRAARRSSPPGAEQTSSDRDRASACAISVVFLRHSKAGKPRHVVLTNEGQRLFAKLAVGKLGDDLIFTRRDGGAWRNSHQLRRMLEACKHAKIKPAVSFHVLRHTHGSTLAMKGVPMGVIAEQLGHADTRMTEKHYAHLAPSYVADTIRAHFPTLGITGKSSVISMRGKG